MPTLSIVVTPGASTANSYVTIIEADTYLFAHPDWERWDALSTDEKQRRLIMATREIDRLDLVGFKNDSSLTAGGAFSQALEFPRSGDTFNGSLFIQVPVKSACCEQAIYIEQTGRGALTARRQMQMEGVTSVNIANDVQETYDLRAAANEFSPKAR